MRAILLLLLQMKPTSASQASCLRTRMPVNLGAFLAKLASERDHCWYSSVRFGLRLR